MPAIFDTLEKLLHDKPYLAGVKNWYPSDACMGLLQMGLSILLESQALEACGVFGCMTVSCFVVPYVRHSSR